ncbi:unnamed protein product [Adineta ricciae]|uniref:G-protein coupled receptors family 1 profile domain-containing protein n=1 Tax=Adineta ricciae TaxID=249248 RepID=A0A815VMK4_ADIRI|nr:unnamed protein product [Adineta ricciae]
MSTRDIFYYAVGIAFIISLLIAFFFSSTIAIIIIYNWRSRCKSVSNFLTVNSCICYILFVLSLFIQVPTLFQNNEQDANNPFSTWCRFRGCFFLIICIIKMLSYTVHAISRYFIIVLHQHRQLLTYGANAIMIGLSWIVGTFIGCAVLISSTAFQYEHESRMCLMSSKVFYTSFSTMSVVFFIPMNTIIILYVLILRHTTRVNHIQSNINTRRKNQRDLKVYQNILRVLCIIIIGGTPYTVSMIVNKFGSIPWPFYSISILFIALATTIECAAMFFVNKDVKAIFYTKLAVGHNKVTQTATVGPTITLDYRRRDLNHATIAQVKA